VTQNVANIFVLFSGLKKCVSSHFCRNIFEKERKQEATQLRLVSKIGKLQNGGSTRAGF